MRFIPSFGQWRCLWPRVRYLRLVVGFVVGLEMVCRGLGYLVNGLIRTTILTSSVRQSGVIPQSIRTGWRTV